MGDLSEERIGELWNLTREGRMLVLPEIADVNRALTELKRHRAAQAASTAQVRSVVYAAIADGAAGDLVSNRDALAIADRVAAQLGPVRLSAEERETLQQMRESRYLSADEAALLDRLLGAKP